jgi:hypothetical protein
MNVTVIDIPHSKEILNEANTAEPAIIALSVASINFLTFLFMPISFKNGDPNESRTRVNSVKGYRPGPLDDGVKMELTVGFEPTTRGLQNRRSTN